MADDEEGSNLLFSDGLADALSAFARARSATQELSSDPPLTFEYQDEGDFAEELCEAFSYAETLAFASTLPPLFVSKWKEFGLGGEPNYSKATPDMKSGFLAMCMEVFETVDTEQHRNIALLWTYLIMGCPGETSSQAEAASIGKSAAMDLIQAGAVPLIVTKLHAAFQAGRERLLASLSAGANAASAASSSASTPPTDSESVGASAAAQAASQAAAEAAAGPGKVTAADPEMSLWSTVLYAIMLAGHQEPGVMEDIMSGPPGSTSPLFPVSLLSWICEFAEKDSRGYPVKKLTLLLWKSITYGLGSISDIAARKQAAMETDPDIPNPPRAPSPPNMDSDTADDDQALPMTSEVPADIIYSKSRENHLKQFESETINKFLQTLPEISDPDANGIEIPAAVTEGALILRKHLYMSPAEFQLSRASFMQKMVLEQEIAKDGSSSPSPSTSPHPLVRSASASPTSAMSSTSAEAASKLTSLLRAGKPLPPDVSDPSAPPRGLVEPENPVEAMYRQALPNFVRSAIILLKILLAAAPTGKAYTGPIHLLDEVTPAEEDPASGAGAMMAEARRKADMTRHKEICAKAVVTSLLLMSKHLRSNHLLQGEWWNLQLVDANCILLILKFLNQDVPGYIRSDVDLPECEPLITKDMLEAILAQEDVAAVTETGRPPRRQTPATSAPPSRPVSAEGLDAIAKQGSGNGGGGQGEEDADSPPRRDSDYSWRNLYTVVNLVRLLRKLTARSPGRIKTIVHYRMGTILKRLLKIHCPILQTYVLKIFKSALPFLGKKWKGSNMKLVSAVYTRLPTEMFDPWMLNDVPDAADELEASRDATLREHVSAFNTYHYTDPHGDRTPRTPRSARSARSDSPASTGSRASSRASSDAHDSYERLYSTLQLDEGFKANYEEWLEREVFAMDDDDVDWVVELGEYHTDDSASESESEPEPPRAIDEMGPPPAIADSPFPSPRLMS